MKSSSSDLDVQIHSDGANISWSISQKMLLIFVQYAPSWLRLPVWFMQSIWIVLDKKLLKNREYCLLKLTQQLHECSQKTIHTAP